MAHREPQLFCGFSRTSLTFGVAALPNSPNYSNDDNKSLRSSEEQLKSISLGSQVDSASGVGCVVLEGRVNPFELDDVIKSICSSLNWTDLISSRLVSHQWNRLSSRLALRSGFISVPRGAAQQKIYVMSKFFDYLSSLAIPLPNISILNLNHIKILKDLRLLGPSTRKLKYFPYPLDTPTHQFIPIGDYKILITQLLHLLPHLTNLSSLSLDHLPPPPLGPQEDPRMANGNWSWEWEPFIRKLNSLEEIQLLHFNLSVLQVYERIQRKIILTTNLTIDQESTSKFLQIFMTSGIRFGPDIRRVRLTLKPDDQIDLVRNFLQNLSDSLIDLTFNFDVVFRGNYNFPIESWQDNWYLPWCLWKVERLMVVERHIPGNAAEDHPGKSVFLYTLLAAMQLSSLRFLYGQCQHPGSFNEVVKTWTENGQGELVGKRKFQALDKLTLYQVASFDDDSFFREPEENLWVNLTQLELLWIGVEEPGPSILKWMFRVLRGQLKVLELKLIAETTSGGSRKRQVPRRTWKHLLLGCPRDDCEGNSSVVTEREYFLKDMTELTRLSILFGYGHKELSVGDALIYDGLLGLKKLEMLDVKNEKFSDEAVNDLKMVLGPNAQIRLNEQVSILELCCLG